MIFHILTIFPDFFTGFLRYGVVARALELGLIQVRIHNLRDWTTDRHQSVDDRPFGGGEGMLLKAQPIFEAVESIWPAKPPGAQTLLLSAQGQRFNQAMAQELRNAPEILLVCGRYEGVDERVAEHLADREVSVGDYVLSGGELPAAIVVDAVARLVPGVLGNNASAVEESFAHPAQPLLEGPQYTRPAEFRGWKVPEVLLGGNHAAIAAWRAQAAREKTRKNRPDLLDAGDKR